MQTNARLICRPVQIVDLSLKLFRLNVLVYPLYMFIGYYFNAFDILITSYIAYKLLWIKSIC